jgi:hypothetical protein
MTSSNNQQRQIEQSAEIREQSSTNSEVNRALDNLARLKQESLEDISDPELRQQMQDFFDEVEEAGKSAFVKELTATDKRYKPEEFSMSDLFGGGDEDDSFLTL